jgi:hypothetical protein
MPEPLDELERIIAASIDDELYNSPAKFREIPEILRKIARGIPFEQPRAAELNALADGFDRYVERLEREAAKFREVAETLGGIAREMVRFDPRRTGQLAALASRFDRCAERLERTIKAGLDV